MSCILKHIAVRTQHKAQIKKENRECEKLVYSSELLSTLSMLFGKNIAARRYPKQKLEEVWKKLLHNQFHDIITGTSIADVYKDAQQDYQDIRKICREIMSNCIQGLSLARKKKQIRIPLHDI